MLEDVAVPDKFAREVLHAKPKGDTAVSRNKGNILRGDIVDARELRIGRQFGLNPNSIHLGHDKVALVDMEGVIERSAVDDSPLFNRTDLKLVEKPFAELLPINVKAINGVEVSWINIGEKLLLQTEPSVNIGLFRPKRIGWLWQKEKRRHLRHRITGYVDRGEHIEVLGPTVVIWGFLSAEGIHEVVGAGICGRSHGP